MLTRRSFCQSAAGVAAAAMIPKALSHPMPSGVVTPVYAQDKPLLELQKAFLDLRFGMFIHFNMATYQDREWGDPTGSVEVFNPTKLNTDQWAEGALSANMGYGCLTTKHHDGFPIWPTKTKVKSVKDTPFRGDIVGQYAESFRKHGLKVALYYSILDLRNDIRHHNITPEKIQLIKDQLTEILTHYGDISAIIFDGWDAPWSRISYEEVPFHEIYEHIKKLQPNCLISELNASQYPSTALYYSDIKAFEQNAGQKLPGDSSIPAQSCVTLTDGWFWKQSDINAELKPTKRIVEEWLVPQNEIHCNLILNAPPTREGLFAPNVMARLAEIGKAWKNPGPAPEIDKNVVISTLNLATGRPIRASNSQDTIGPDEANDGNFGSTWTMEPQYTDGWLEIDLKPGTSFNTLVLNEPVGRWDDYKKSRITHYAFQGWKDGAWTTLVEGNQPARCQIHSIPRTRANKIRLVLKGSEFHISEIGVYDEPVRH